MHLERAAVAGQSLGLALRTLGTVLALREGGLLVAPVGKGTYVYTGIAFFRELPAGVPGAYRLFMNLLALRPAGALP